MTTSPGSAERSHRFPLGGTSWYVWRDALLRTTGFPAAGLDLLAAPDCATVADAYLDGRAELDKFQAQFDNTIAECSGQVNRIAADNLLREAITWQNPAAVTLLDSLQRSGPPAPRNSKRRYRELQLTRFWQRYCAKTETIGFFGPALWATVDPDTRLISAVPGADLIERRRVFLEPWTLTAYGAVLAEDPDIRKWLPPSPIPHYYLDGMHLCRPDLPPVSLAAAEVTALTLCNGRRPAAQIVAKLAAEHALDGEEDGYRLLESLVSRRLLKWDANLPLGPQTEALLIERIAAIGDEGLRHRARSGLERLTKARDAVAGAAGDPHALAAAMAALDVEFTEITGREPRRRHGQTYAGRGLCYEDTTRDLRVVVGSQLLDEVAPALALVLQAARWFTSELARGYEATLQEAFSQLPAENEQPTLGDLWYQAIKLFWDESRRRPIDGIVETLTAHWASLFALPTASATAKQLYFNSAELTERAQLAFAADRPGWSIARIHSPDLIICATSPEAINEGDYLAVLGELHIAYATLCDRWCTWSRAEPGRILELAIQDFGQPRLVPLLPALWSKDAGRNVQIEDDPTDWHIGFAKVPGVDADRLVPMGAVPVFLADGRLMGTLPDGRDLPLIEFFSHFLCTVAVNAFRNVSTASHTPRITIDRMVLFRETWRMTIADLGELTSARGDQEQYLAARRLVAKLDLPNRCFVKIPTEKKPFYVDFTGPLYVASLCTMLRAAKESRGGDTPVTVTEMLPTPDQTWVADSAGRRYFGEFRLHLTDPEPAQPGRRSEDMT